MLFVTQTPLQVQRRAKRSFLISRIPCTSCLGQMSRIYAADGDSSHAGSHHDEESVHSSSVDEVINIRGDQFDGKDKSDVELLDLNYLDLWALGLSTAMGSHFLSWSSGLSAGFGSFIIAVFLTGAAYYCLVLCISELSSALPFAGGAYGIARVTLGIFPGFLVGCYDSYKSVLCVAAAAFTTGRIITNATGGPKELQPVYWTVFYIYTLAVNGRGGICFWRIIKITTAATVGLLLVFLLGSIKFGNFEKHAALTGQSGNEEWFHGGMSEFMQVLPTSTRFFVGIQSINLACGQIKEPKVEVPRGSVAAISTATLTSLVTVFVVCSLPPGIFTVRFSLNPLTDGYALMFGITRAQALWLSLPAVVTYGLGYMYMYGKQLSAMGQSGLLPYYFGYEISVRHTPVVAHVLGAVVGYGICILLYFEGESRVGLNNIVILGAMVAYMSIFLSFLMFRNYFPTIKREFISPLGTAGAVYGFVMFLLIFISYCGFQQDTYAIQSFAYITVVLSIYYYVRVRPRQIFSEEEKKVMFKAYLVKNNMDKKTRMRKRASSAAPGHAPTPSHASLNLYTHSGSRDEDHSGSVHRFRSGSATTTPHSRQIIHLKNNNNSNSMHSTHSTHSADGPHPHSPTSITNTTHTATALGVQQDKEASTPFSFGEPKQRDSSTTFPRTVLSEEAPAELLEVESASSRATNTADNAAAEEAEQAEKAEK